MEKSLLFREDEEDLFSALSSAREIVIHNLKPVFVAAAKKGMSLRPSFFDTMLAVYLINPSRKDYGIQGILSEFLDVDINGDGRESSPREERLPTCGC